MKKEKSALPEWLQERFAVRDRPSVSQRAAKDLATSLLQNRVT